jgi:hypothetical protein
MASDLSRALILLSLVALAACGSDDNGGGGGQNQSIYNEVYSCDEGGSCVDLDVMDSLTFVVNSNGTAQTVENGQVIFSGPFDPVTGVFGPWSGNGCSSANPCNESGTWVFTDNDGDGEFDSYSGPSSYTYTTRPGGGDCVSAGNLAPASAPASAGPIGGCP